MTPTRLQESAGGKGRRGSAMVLVLLLTFALAALAGSAILLSSTAKMTVRSRDAEKDLRYTADAAVAIGESQIENNSTVVPTSGYATLASNQPMLAADSTAVPGLTYNLFVGPSGEVSRQNGRFVTLVAQSIDSLHHRSFVRRVELLQESFAKFAYFSNSENGICFGSGDVLWGPVFSNGTIATCAGQNATFHDSVEAHVYVDSEVPAVFADNPMYPPRMAVPIINLPNTAGLANLYAIAALGNTTFTSSNTATDSTSKLRSRLEFDAYNDSSTFGSDSVQLGEGFVKFYSLDETLAYWQAIPSAKRDSSAASYLRAGLGKKADPRNCGDWHFVADSTPGGPAATYSWQFFPMFVHDSAWFQAAAKNLGPYTIYGQKYTWLDGNGQYHWFVKDAGVGPTYAIGLDSTFTDTSANRPILVNQTHAETYYITNFAVAGDSLTLWHTVITPQRDGQTPAPVCYPGGDPHLVSVERTGWAGANTKGMGWRGGTDSTYTLGTPATGATIAAPNGVGRWSVWPSTAIVWTNAGFKGRHADWQLLFPIDTVKSPAFKGVIAVHGSVGISGNVDGHVTVYSDGSVGMIDNTRLVTNTGDSLCLHGMGIVAGNDITALDNGINVPQHWTQADLNGTVLSHWVDLRNSSLGGSLYMQSTVMALGSWGAENLNADSSYVSTVYCSPASPPDFYKRGCLYVFGSIIQNSRQTVNSGAGGPGGYGYAKQYSYDICAVQNPLPYFPTTGRLIENKYYEHDPNHFNVTALYQSLQGP